MASLTVLHDELPGPANPWHGYSSRLLSRTATSATPWESPPSPGILAALTAAGHARRAWQKMAGPPTKPYFAPGAKVAAYPNGYTLDQVGP